MRRHEIAHIFHMYIFTYLQLKREEQTLFLNIEWLNLVTAVSHLYFVFEAQQIKYILCMTMNSI